MITGRRGRVREGRHAACAAARGRGGAARGPRRRVALAWAGSRALVRREAAGPGRARRRLALHRRGVGAARQVRQHEAVRRGRALRGCRAPCACRELSRRQAAANAGQQHACARPFGLQVRRNMPKLRWPASPRRRSQPQGMLHMIICQPMSRDLSVVSSKVMHARRMHAQEYAMHSQDAHPSAQRCEQLQGAAPPAAAPTPLHLPSRRAPPPRPPLPAHRWRAARAPPCPRARQPAWGWW